MIPRELDDFAAELRHRLRDIAEVIQGGENEWPEVRVRPRRSGAVHFSWSDGGAWLIFEVGDHCVWELDDDDAGSVQAMAEAVIVGAGQEVSGPGGRHRVVLTLADGSQQTRTAYEACLPTLVPLPFWPRWSPRRQFEPYS